MSNSDHKITLTVTASGGYSYSGGNDGGKGNVKNDTKKGKSKIDITLNAPKGYTISRVDFQEPHPGISADNPKDNKVKIDNDCEHTLDVKYSVIVVDGSTGKEILCDPKIINKPV